MSLLSVDRSSKTKVIFIIGLLIVAVMAALMITKTVSPIERLEGMIYDIRLRLAGTTKPPDTIVIAAIDERSIEKLGRWPWGRDTIARLITKLSDAGAELIVFDIFMSEQEEHDPVLAKAVREASNVLVPLVFYFDRATGTAYNEALTNSAFHAFKNPEKFRSYAPISAKGVLAPVPELMQETMNLGHINMRSDDDGVLRWELAAVEYKGYLYPSLDLQTAAVYLAIPHQKIVLHATEGIQLGSKRFIPTDEYGRTLIHYYGPSETFKTLSVADIIEGKIDPQQIQGKIVLIGATALGIYDLRVTPFSEVMAGVEKHAIVIASTIDNRFLKNAEVSLNIVVLII